MINSKANREFHFPKSKRFGTKINSIIFMLAMIVTWNNVANLDRNFDKIQNAMTTSDNPMHCVISPECFLLIISATIS